MSLQREKTKELEVTHGNKTVLLQNNLLFIVKEGLNFIVGLLPPHEHFICGSFAERIRSRTYLLIGYTCDGPL